MGTRSYYFIFPCKVAFAARLGKYGFQHYHLLISPFELPKYIWVSHYSIPTPPLTSHALLDVPRFPGNARRRQPRLPEVLHKSVSRQCGTMLHLLSHGCGLGLLYYLYVFDLPEQCYNFSNTFTVRRKKTKLQYVHRRIHIYFEAMKEDELTVFTCLSEGLQMNSRLHGV